MNTITETNTTEFGKCHTSIALQCEVTETFADVTVSQLCPIPSVTDADITIQQIYTKYTDDPYMMNRVHSYICNQLQLIIV